MSRTITAMFDSRADAEAGKQRLIEANIDANNVHIHDQSSSGFRSEGSYSSHHERGVWDSIKNAFLPDEDRHTYEEGMRRGGCLLTADVDEHEVDEAVRALESANGIDIDERAGQWRSQGWNYGATGAAGIAADGLTPSSYGSSEGATGYGQDRLATATGDNDDRIDIVQEELLVGRREVDRGGVRVRSYVTERPVHEQVRLRDEQVNVERRPVDRPLNASDDAFRERTIEMTATGEEAVVGKTARVVEEVVVHKDVGTRVEEIDDTVRRTDVEVENLTGSDRAASTDRAAGSGLGLSGDDDLDRSSDLRRDTTTDRF